MLMINHNKPIAEGSAAAPRMWRLKHPKIYLSVAIVLVASALGAIFIALSHKHVQPPPSYVTFQLSQGANDSISFLRPVSSKVLSRNLNEAAFVMLSGKPPLTIAYLDAYSTASPPSISKYLKSQLPPKWHMDLNPKPKQYKLPKQKLAAQIYSFTAGGPNGRGGTSSWDGRILYVHGQKSDYYLLITAARSYWQSWPYWLAIFNSVSVK